MMKKLNTLNKRTAKVAAKWWADRLKTGDKEKFKNHLEKSILKTISNEPKVCFVECDYDPQDILLDAVRAAGVKCAGFMYSSEGVLPQKHSTVISRGLIKPKEGYANWTEHIFIK